MLQFRYRFLESLEGVIVREHTLSISNTNGDEVDHGLLPRQPHRNARRMSHEDRMAGGAPALQLQSSRGALRGCKASAPLAKLDIGQLRLADRHEFALAQHDRLGAADELPPLSGGAEHDQEDE